MKTIRKVAVLLWILMFTVMMVACDDYNSETTPKIETNVQSTPKVVTLAAPASSLECEGKNYEDVVAMFKSAGFTNVKSVSSDIDADGSLREDGEVVSVLAGNSDYFDKGDLLEKNVKIEINYVVLVNSSVEGHNVEKMSGTMYATTSLNVRALPDKASEKVGGLAVNQGVEVTGLVDNGWYRIAYNGEEAYVHGNYLSFEKSDNSTQPVDRSIPVSENVVAEAVPVTNDSAPTTEPTTISNPEPVNVPVVEQPSSSAGNVSSSGGDSVIVPGYEDTQGNLVWVPVNGGTKYHSRSSCSNMDNPMQVTVEHAEANGYTPCKRCH